jgi:hypothetical protein
VSDAVIIKILNVCSLYSKRVATFSTQDLVQLMYNCKLIQVITENKSVIYIYNKTFDILLPVFNTGRGISLNIKSVTLLSNEYNTFIKNMSTTITNLNKLLSKFPQLTNALEIQNTIVNPEQCVIGLKLANGLNIPVKSVKLDTKVPHVYPIVYGNYIDLIHNINIYSKSTSDSRTIFMIKYNFLTEIYIRLKLIISKHFDKFNEKRDAETWLDLIKPYVNVVSEYKTPFPLELPLSRLTCTTELCKNGKLNITKNDLVLGILKILNETSFTSSDVVKKTVPEYIEDVNNYIIRKNETVVISDVNIKKYFN